MKEIKEFFLLLRDNPNLAVAITVFPLLAIVSFFVNSFGVFVAVLLSCLGTMLWLLKKERCWLAEIAYVLSLAVGIGSAFVDNPIYDKAASIFMLSATAFANPNDYGFTEDNKQELFRSVVVCGSDGVNSAAGIALDLAGSVYEPVEMSSFSWIWKQKEPRQTCLDTATKLAEISPSYKTQLDTVLAE